MHHRMLLRSGPENLQEIPNLLVLGTAVGGGIEWKKKKNSTQWQHHTGLGILAFTRVSCEAVHCRDYVGVSETPSYEEPIHLFRFRVHKDFVYWLGGAPSWGNLSHPPQQ